MLPSHIKGGGPENISPWWRGKSHLTNATWFIDGPSTVVMTTQLQSTFGGLKVDWSANHSVITSGLSSIARVGMCDVYSCRLNPWVSQINISMRMSVCPTRHQTTKDKTLLNWIKQKVSQPDPNRMNEMGLIIHIYYNMYNIKVLSFENGEEL